MLSARVHSQRPCASTFLGQDFGFERKGVGPLPLCPNLKISPHFPIKSKGVGPTQSLAPRHVIGCCLWFSLEAHVVGFLALSWSGLYRLVPLHQVSVLAPTQFPLFYKFSHFSSFFTFALLFSNSPPCPLPLALYLPSPTPALARLSQACPSHTQHLGSQVLGLEAPKDLPLVSLEVKAPHFCFSLFFMLLFVYVLACL